jgi:hypothetical protein
VEAGAGTEDEKSEKENGALLLLFFLSAPEPAESRLEEGEREAGGIPQRGLGSPVKRPGPKGARPGASRRAALTPCTYCVQKLKSSLHMVDVEL